MKYGQIAGNKSVNETIYRCFEYICEEDARKFVKKFAELPQDGPQVMHIFRELIVGSYLASIGFSVRYDYLIDSHTPDWCLFDKASNLTGIVEVTNFHANRNIEREIKEAFQKKRLWVDWMPSNENRLYQSIWNKAQVYRDLLEKYCVPYIIAVFGDFFAAVDIDEVNQCLGGTDIGLFELYPTISGILFFEEKVGKYHFKYFPNSHATKGMEISEYIFP